jgi:hypothetical protein
MASITQLYAKKYRVCYLHKDAWTVTEDTYATIEEFLDRAEGLTEYQLPYLLTNDNDLSYEN